MSQAQENDPFATLSAIWILASNDEKPEMSYAGLRHRLRLSGAEGEERALVARHGELFRLRIPTARLAEIKERYLKGERLPAWLRAIPEGPERQQAIERLSTDDLFRSQFRAEADAPRSPIEIVDWGLQHIDRLRKSAAENREAPWKRWSSVWIPLCTMLVALAAVVSTGAFQYRASIDQRELKEFEISFRPKLDGYTRFLQAVSTSFERSQTQDFQKLGDALNEVELAAIQLEPLLRPDVRDRWRTEVQRFAEFCRDTSRSHASDDRREQFQRFRNGFRDTLYSALFR